MNLLKFTDYYFLVVAPCLGVKPVQLVSSSTLLTFLVSCLGKPQNTAKHIFFQGGMIFRWGRGGGGPLIPLRKNSAKKRYLWSKTPILGLFGPSYGKNLRQFSVQRGFNPPFLIRFYWNDFPVRGWAMPPKP